jgi:hypothetical protein
MGFQTVVNTVPGVGVAGDFCSNNEYYSVDAGPGGLVAGPLGITVGLFAWVAPPYDTDGAPAAASNFGGGPIAGFVHREMQGLITPFLLDGSMFVPAGFPITLMSGGDFWVTNNGATQATPGMYAYANPANGQASFAAAGASTQATLTSATIVAGTAATFTGSISGSILTAGTVTNTIYPGAKVTGTNVATGTNITAQLTGVTGAAGTYSVSVPEQTVASTALTVTPYILAGTGSGVVVGSTILSDTGAITPNGGAVINAPVTMLNTPGAGQYIVATYGATAVTGTVVLASTVQTKFVAMSSGLTGELVKMSSHVLG